MTLGARGCIVRVPDRGDTPVRIDEETAGTAFRMTLSGDLDSFSASSLGERINRQIDAGFYTFIIDLTGVEFMDSTGLGQLVASLKMCLHHGGDLILAAANEDVLELLRITKLDKVFKRYDTAEQAVSAIGG